MTIEIKVPVLPESVADATVVTWHKQPGEFVERDENLVDIETDKVVLEVPAPDSGMIEKIIEQEGATVVSNQLLANFVPGEGTKATATTTAKPAPEAVEITQIAAPSDRSTSAAGPSARRAAAEQGADISAIRGSGRGGRITKMDVLTMAPSGARPEKRVPMTRLRARVAERLLAAQHDAAILTTFNEVNLQQVMNLRAEYKDQFEKKHGVKLGFMSFFTKATVEALKQFPSVNASIDGNDIVYHGYYDIGIAVSTERGLVVPVVRDADKMSMAQIEASINDYAGKARDGRLTIEEMTGGTFTLTNGGVFGSLISTPILNPPQTGILGMHKIEQRAIVENGEIVARPMMYIALSYDHRIIDGKESVQFLVKIKEMLEDPARMLLEL